MAKKKSRKKFLPDKLPSRKLLKKQKKPVIVIQAPENPLQKAVGFFKFGEYSLRRDVKK